MHRTSAGVSTVNNKTVTFSKPSKISQHSTVSLLRKTWGESGYNLIELLSTTLKLLDGVSVKHSTHNIVFVFFFILNYGKSHTSIWYDETTTSVVFVLFKTLMQINNKNKNTRTFNTQSLVVDTNATIILNIFYLKTFTNSWSLYFCLLFICYYLGGGLVLFCFCLFLFVFLFSFLCSFFSFVCLEMHIG